MKKMKMKKMIIPVAALIMFAMSKKTERSIFVTAPPEKLAPKQTSCNSPNQSNQLSMDLTLLSNSE
jgi:uncharacterized lipoprotein YajG